VQSEAGDMLDNAIRRNVVLNVEKLETTKPIINMFVDSKKVRVGRRHLQTGVRERELLI
jgi:hypothetical protein